MPADVAIGIDLGTSTTCAAVVKDGKPVVIADSKGDRVHASVVSFRDDGSVIVGNAAKKLIAIEPSSTVWSAKRLIGRFYFSDEVKKAQSHVGYQIIEGANSSVRIRVKDKELTPSDIGGLVLKKIRRMAEENLGQPVTKAVITVPAYFNDNQRKATRDAGEIAGLEVLRIINEPTAAALAYGYGKNIKRRVAIYDLGGGTFDVSVLEIGAGVYEVLSTAGDTYLGGDDFDNRLVDFLANNFFQETGIDVRADRPTLVRLSEAAEYAKRQLSAAKEYTFDLPNLAGGKGLKKTLTIAEFSRMTMDLIQRTFKVCDEALQGAKMTVGSLEGVVLVGGPTRLPFIRQSVEHYFQRRPDDGVDPDEVVALGAALQAHALVTGEGEATLLDVTPFPLRIATVGGFTEEIIAKNSPIPMERSRTFTTSADNQEKVKVTVLQGDGRRVEDCVRLGEFEFSGLRPAPRGEVEVQVTFEIDSNGIVNVFAKDKESGRTASTTIRLSGSLSRAEKAEAVKRTEDTVITGAAQIVRH